MAVSTRTGSAAIAWGRRQITYPSKSYYRLCLQFVRLCFNVVARDSSAATSWSKNKYRHFTTNAASIPAGVPVYWNTSGVYDHVALSTGNGKCLSNDILRSGKIDEVSIDYITRRWGAKLLGWSEDINGVRVYRAAAAPAPSTSPATYLSKLHFGQRDSDSVRNLQRALNGHKLRGGQTLPVTGYYGAQTDEEVRLCQAQHGFGPKVGTADPVNRSNVGPAQAKHLGLPNIRS